MEPRPRKTAVPETSADTEPAKLLPLFRPVELPLSDPAPGAADAIGAPMPLPRRSPPRGLGIFRLQASLAGLATILALLCSLLAVRYGNEGSTLNTLIILLTGFCLLMAVGGWVSLRNLRTGVLDPLFGLGVALQRVASGELEVRAAEVGAPEISEVARKFNSMVASLELQAREDAAGLMLGRSSFSSSYRGLAVFDEELACVNHNETLPRLLDTSGSLTGRSLAEVVSSLELGETGREVLRSGRPRRRMQFALGGGHPRKVLWITLLPETDRQGATRLLLIVEDPSERFFHAGHSALQAAALESVDEAVIVTNSEGRIESVNAGFTAQTGYSREEAVGQTPALLKSGLVEDSVYRELWKTLESGQIWRGVLTNRRKDGSTFEAALTIAPVPSAGDLAKPHYVAVSRDLTADTEASASFRRLIENFPTPIGLHREGQWVFVNRALCATLGFSAEELIGRSPLKIVHLLDREQAKERVRRLVEEGEKARPEEERVVCKDGRVLTHEVTAMQVDFEDEATILIAARDVTEQRRMMGQLMASDRLAAAGTLAGGVGHEINNPLSFLSANLEFIREALEAPETAESRAELLEVLTEAKDGARRISEIVKRLKVFTSGGQGGLRPIDLAAVLETSLGLTGNEIRHRATLETDFKALPPVRARADELAQVFVNLLLNAAQAIPAGDAAHHLIRVAARQKAGWIEVRIEDSGEGIPDEVLHAVFDPFFTTKAPGKGTGLGLSMGRQIIESLGGHIEIDTQVGQGTHVRVRLPVADPALRTPETRAPPPPEPSGEPGRPRVLILDDDLPVGRSLCRILAPTHETVLCGGGQEALERLAAGEHFDAIVCDLMMPDLTGMAFHDALTRTDPLLASRVLFVTGGAFTPEARTFAQAHEDRLIEKPVDFEELRTRVQEMTPAAETAPDG